MKQCPRCLKHIAEVGTHTCNPTEYVQKLETKVAKLLQERKDISELLVKLGKANGDLGALLTSTSKVQDLLAQRLEFDVP